MKKERWKRVFGFEEYYKVSSRGRVLSLGRNYIQTNGCRKVVNERILSQSFNRANGYLYVCLWKNLKPATKSVHKLVAVAFVKNKLNLPEVNHKNLNKKNNNDWNLEWCNRSQNQKHSFKNGNMPHLKTMAVGEGNANAKLNEVSIKAIRSSTKSRDWLASRYGVHRQHINAVIAKRVWKHIK